MTIEQRRRRSARVGVYGRVPIDPLKQESSARLIKEENRLRIETKLWKITGFYLDEGDIGANREKLLEDCRNGDIDLVVTRSIKCFSKDIPELIEICGELSQLEHPVGVLFSFENIFSLDDSFGTKLSFIVAIAVKESWDRLTRTFLKPANQKDRFPELK